MTRSTTRPPRGPLSHLDEALRVLERDGLLRTPPAPLAPGALSFCSNDYLGLAVRPAPAEASGSGASRLVAGERSAHVTFEQAAASWLGVDACLAFSSGYAANVGAIAALASNADLIVSDELNHASIIDGARLSRARVVVTPHNDIPAITRALAERDEVRAWVLVESYYSMDADGPDLAALRIACDATGAALVVDEAHALGVFGPRGRGRCADAAIAPDVLIGTLGKAFGGQGAFVAGSRSLRAWLWNRARSFVFSTGLAPSAAAVGERGLAYMTSEEGAAARVKVERLAQRLRAGLQSRIPELRVSGFGHIVPIIIGDTTQALRLSSRLSEHGMFVPAIRPPTVPDGTARLRLTVTAAHEAADIDTAVAHIERALRPCP